MYLRGKELLAKIYSIHVSYDLLTFKGNLRDILVECDYIKDNNDAYSEKASKRALSYFYYEYWKALKDNNIFQQKGSIHKRLGSLGGLLKIKFKHKLTEAEKEEKKKEKEARELYLRKNPPIGNPGKLLEYVDPTKIDTNFKRDELVKGDNKIYKKSYKKLYGDDLFNEVIKSLAIGKEETSICILTGYEVSKIGLFRRAFAKATGVKFAPLERMIKEMRENELISKNKSENKKTKEIFIDREKIKSQVNRLYRNPKFREKVLNKHGSICSCCDIALEKLLEAAHIIPVEDNGTDDVDNGLPLCPNHHTAFDNFLFTISPTNHAIIYKDGVSSKDIQITKTKCELNLSNESLEYRYKLFKEY